MDPPRRPARSLIDPKVRQVGFFAPGNRTNSDSLSSFSSSSPATDISPSGNSLSPVMIPPPRHSSDTQILLSSFRPVGPHFPPVPSSPLRRPLSDAVAASHLVVGSYNPSDIFPSESEDSEEVLAVAGAGSGGGKGRRGSGGGDGGGSKFASSLPSGGGGGSGYELMVGKVGRNGGVGVNSSGILVNLPSGVTGTLMIY